MNDKTDNGDLPDQPESEDAVEKKIARTENANHGERHKSLDSLTAALRNNYQSTVDEGVPDIFDDLIQKLK